MTEIVQHTQTTALADQMEYARVVSSGALLPQAYRGKPADILIAVGLGQAMGLSPAESLYRIDVIQGKPTASAELIAANVRKAGHKLRVRVDEQAQSVTATIVRADDADYEHTVVRDMVWAKRMGLDSKDNYKKQPTTMLQWRAVSAVARMACPEALYGVAYTADEMEDQRPAVSAPTVSVASFQPAREDVGPAINADEPRDAEVVDEDGQVETISDGQRRAMFAAFTDAGFTTDARSAEGRAARLEYIGRIIGRPVESSNDLTHGEASQVINALNEDATAAGEQA